MEATSAGTGAAAEREIAGAKTELGRRKLAIEDLYRAQVGLRPLLEDERALAISGDKPDELAKVRRVYHELTGEVTPRERIETLIRQARDERNPARRQGKIIFDWANFKRNVFLASKIGQSGYGYLLPAVAGVAAVGSVAQDALLFAVGGELAAAANAPKALPLIAGTAATGRVVIGQYPRYLELADELGAKRFNIPPAIWEKMSDAERLGANNKFLDRAIARGDTFMLTMSVKEALQKGGIWLKHEIEYVLSRGYTVGKDGMSLIPRK